MKNIHFVNWRCIVNWKRKFINLNSALKICKAFIIKNAIDRIHFVGHVKSWIHDVGRRAVFLDEVCDIALIDVPLCVVCESLFRFFIIHVLQIMKIEGYKFKWRQIFFYVQNCLKTACLNSWTIFLYLRHFELFLVKLLLVAIVANKKVDLE